MTTLAHNTQNDHRLSDLTKLVRELGNESVKSELAKPKLALAAARAAQDGVIGEDDVAAVHDTYVAGRAGAIGRNKMAMTGDTSKSDAVQKSKLTQIVKAALLPAVDMVELLDKVIDAREALIKGEVKVKSTFDAFVDIARAQLKTPSEPLADDAIEAVIKKPEAKSKDVLAKLGELYKKTYKLAEQMGDEMLDCEHIEAARDAIATAIQTLDGEVPSMSKQEKEDAEHLAFLMSKGMSRNEARAFMAK